MPAPVRSVRPAPARRSPAGHHTVKPGDTLSGIARARLGDAGRWRELHALNRAVIGPDPAAIRPGMVLRLPTSAERPADRDGDGLSDRHDAGPDDAANRAWSREAAREFEAHLALATEKLREAGVEIDCADFSAKLVADFAAERGLPDPLAGYGGWHAYTPDRTGGLANVAGPNWVLPGIRADNLAKVATRRVNDADGDGIAGFDDRTGAVDTRDLAPGDLLFFDWDADGVVNHTMNVLDVAPDGTVTVAYGTYDNLAPGEPLRWEKLDLKPIQVFALKPGTPEYHRYLGPGNRLYGVHRYHWMPEKAPVAPEPAPPGAPAPAPAPWWKRAYAAVTRWLGPRKRVSAIAPGLLPGTEKR